MDFEVEVFIPAQGNPLFEVVAYDGNDKYHYQHKFYNAEVACIVVKECRAAVKAGSFLDTDVWIKFSH